jgi:hypothetical protein
MVGLGFLELVDVHNEEWAESAVSPIYVGVPSVQLLDPGLKL